MNLFPYQFHNINNKKFITNDAGEFFFTNEKHLDKLIKREIDGKFTKFLLNKGFRMVLLTGKNHKNNNQYEHQNLVEKTFSHEIP